MIDVNFIYMELFLELMNYLPEILFFVLGLFITYYLAKFVSFCYWYSVDLLFKSYYKVKVSTSVSYEPEKTEGYYDLYVDSNTLNNTPTDNNLLTKEETEEEKNKRIFKEKMVITKKFPEGRK